MTMQAPLRYLILTAFISCAPPEAPPSDLTTRTAAATFDHPPIAARELLITDVSAVDDPKYTTVHPDKWNTDAEGGWSFARLMDNLSPHEKPSPQQRTRFVLSWLKLWETDQTVNGFRVPARPAVRALVIDPWRLASGCAPDLAALGQIDPRDRCTLDFRVAPFRLLAVVNRADLRIAPSAAFPAGSAGQGRFVFGVLGREADGSERRFPFTVIFEYQLPTSGWSDIIAWAERWHRLGRSDLPFGAKYNKELFEVTREFTKWRVMSGTPNGSALLQIRTNEVSLSGETPKIWEMREFVLSPSGDRLVQTTVKQEPDLSFSGTPELASFLLANAAAIDSGAYDVPALLGSRPFLAGSSIVRTDYTWSAPGVPQATRDRFALGTCGGCHFSETGGAAGTNFLHIKNRARGAAAALSPFLRDELAGLRVNDFAGLLLAKDRGDVTTGPGKDRGNEKGR